MEYGLRKPEVYNNLALALQELGRTQEASGHLRRALTPDPGYADAWYNSGAALEKLGRHEEALAAYDRALARLAETRLTAPLFDTEGYTRSLEAAYAATVERARNGLLPEHLDAALEG